MSNESIDTLGEFGKGGSGVMAIQIGIHNFWSSLMEFSGNWALVIYGMKPFSGNILLPSSTQCANLRSAMLWTIFILLLTNAGNWSGSA